MFDGQTGIPAGSQTEIFFMGYKHRYHNFLGPVFVLGKADKPVIPGIVKFIVDGTGLAADIEPGKNFIPAIPFKRFSCGARSPKLPEKWPG